MLDLCLNVVLAKINTIRHTPLYMYQRSLNQGSSCICLLYDPVLTSCTLIPLSQQKSHHAFYLSRILCSDDIEFFINMYTLLYADDTLVFAESPEEL